jgi:hypothetical protein
VGSRGAFLPWAARRPCRFTARRSGRTPVRNSSRPSRADAHTRSQDQWKAPGPAAEDSSPARADRHGGWRQAFLPHCQWRARQIFFLYKSTAAAVLFFLSSLCASSRFLVLTRDEDIKGALDYIVPWMGEMNKRQQVSRGSRRDHRAAMVEIGFAAVCLRWSHIQTTASWPSAGRRGPTW